MENNWELRVVQSSLQRIAVGNAGAIRECIDEFSPLVWSLARRLTRTPSDAEDATQDIFLSIWCNASRFDPAKGSDKAFIMMIARRRLIDRLRRNALEPPMESMDFADETPCDRAEVFVSSRVQSQYAERAFATLRSDQQAVLELSLFDGLTQAEIATRLTLPLGTVKSSMRRGLQKLRDAATDSDWAVPQTPLAALGATVCESC